MTGHVKHAVMPTKISNTKAWNYDTELLITQKEAQTGAPFCDYELKPIAGIGGFMEHATDALGFDDEHFNMQDTQAISCRICGGIFKDLLWVMRRHRLNCGWR